MAVGKKENDNYHAEKIEMLLAMIVILKMMMKCHCLLTVDFMAVVVGGSSVTMSPRKHLLVTSILNTLDILRKSFRYL